MGYSGYSAGVLWVLGRGTLGTRPGYSGYSAHRLKSLDRAFANGVLWVLSRGTLGTRPGYSGYSAGVLWVLGAQAKVSRPSFRKFQPFGVAVCTDVL